MCVCVCVCVCVFVCVCVCVCFESIQASLRNKVSHWRRKDLRKLRGGGGAHGSGTCFETYRIANLFVGSSGLDAILSDRQYFEGSVINFAQDYRECPKRQVTEGRGSGRPTSYIRHRCLHYVQLYRV